jgi:hypothetical protein
LAETNRLYPTKAETESVAERVDTLLNDVATIKGLDETVTDLAEDMDALIDGLANITECHASSQLHTSGGACVSPIPLCPAVEAPEGGNITSSIEHVPGAAVVASCPIGSHVVGVRCARFPCRVFPQKSSLEVAIDAHACSLEANMHVAKGIPLGWSFLLPVGTVNYVQTLKDSVRTCLRSGEWSGKQASCKECAVEHCIHCVDAGSCIECVVGKAFSVDVGECVDSDALYVFGGKKQGNRAGEKLNHLGKFQLRLPELPVHTAAHLGEVSTPLVGIIDSTMYYIPYNRPGQAGGHPMWVLTPGASAWKENGVNALWPFGNTACRAVIGNKWYVVNENGNFGYYNPAELKWTNLPGPDGFNPNNYADRNQRYGCLRGGWAQAGTKFYMVGGTGRSGTKAHATVIRVFDTKRQAWEKSGDLTLPVPRYDHATVAHEGHLYALGGRSRSTDGDMSKYDRDPYLKGWYNDGEEVRMKSFEVLELSTGKWTTVAGGGSDYANMPVWMTCMGLVFGDVTSLEDGLGCFGLTHIP